MVFEASGRLLKTFSNRLVIGFKATCPGNGFVTTDFSFLYASLASTLMVSAAYLTLFPVNFMPCQNLAKTGPAAAFNPAVMAKSLPTSPSVLLSSVSPK